MAKEALSALLEDLAAAPRAGEAWQRPLAAGETVGRFELLREIGRGGFGVVYEARDRELGRAVAFKAVRPGQLPSREAGEQLVREAEAIARLSHPNLVTLYDVGRCEHGPFLVLELLRGATLKERLAHGPLAVTEALRVATEVARGLAHAHAHGVVHRDLKPSNVFLCEGGLVKVLDFGMAHAFGRTRLAGGTPAYMAPEQWRDAPEDERTDVFALGVMLHEMLAGEPPFPHGGKDLQDGRGAPTLRVPDVPALGHLVARMLQEDPVARPRHAGEVLEVLEALHAELVRSRTGGSTRTVTVSFAPRRAWLRPAALLAAGAVLAAAAGLAWRQWARGPAPAAGPPCVAVLPFTSLSSSPDDAYFAEGVHGELITQLAKIAGLRVIARSSVQAYASGRRDLPAIARALSAGAILEGTVQRAGQRVRVTAHLVDPRTGTETWADRFDRKVDDVFQIQTEVALEIARTLGARLSPSERALVERAPTRDAEAHDLYRRALYFWQRSMDVASDNQMARDLLERALQRDPEFAAAHAWLAIIAAARDCDAARRHAGRALALQPDLPLAHAALGDVRQDCDGDDAGAIAAYREAVRGAPGDAASRVALGGLRTGAGDVQGGLDDLRAALALDPRSFVVAVEVARELALARQWDEAQRACQQAEQLSPGDVHALATCALIPFWRSGDAGPARAAVEALPRELPTGGAGAVSVFQLLAAAPDRALELLDAGRLPDPFSDRPFIPRALLAGTVHAGLGHAAAARAAFAAAVGPLEQRVRAAPGDHLALLLLARAHAGAGQAEAAVREASRAVELAPAPQLRAMLLRYQAEVLLAAGRRGEAVQTLGRAVAHPQGVLTAASAAADPRYAALRGDPAFERLVAGAPAR